MTQNREKQSIGKIGKLEWGNVDLFLYKNDLNI